MIILQEEIRTLIPHAGRMCLWESVEQWDTETIRCLTHSHFDALNPLRDGGQLSALHLLEYGAQAMAIHGGLLARAARTPASRAGVLASARDLVLHVQRIDTVDDALTGSARKLMANAGGSIYEFEIKGGAQLLASGRVTAMLTAVS